MCFPRLHQDPYDKDVTDKQYLCLYIIKDNDYCINYKNIEKIACIWTLNKLPDNTCEKILLLAKDLTHVCSLGHLDQLSPNPATQLFHHHCTNHSK